MSFASKSEEPFSSGLFGSSGVFSGSSPSSWLVGSTLLEEPKRFPKSELPLGAWGVEVSVVVTSSAAAREVPAKGSAAAAAPATSALREKSILLKDVDERQDARRQRIRPT